MEAQIIINGKNKHIGLFPKRIEAHASYLKAEKEQNTSIANIHSFSFFIFPPAIEILIAGVFLLIFYRSLPYTSILLLLILCRYLCNIAIVVVNIYNGTILCMDSYLASSSCVYPTNIITHQSQNQHHNR